MSLKSRVARRALALKAAFVLALAAVSARADVVVSALTPHGAGTAAGLAVGDRLTAFGPRRTPLDSPFAFERLLTFEAPRGPLQLRGQRDGVARVFTLQVGDWGVSVDPDVAPDVRERDAQARQLASEGQTERADEIWSSLARELQSRGRARDAAWLMGRAAEADVGPTPARARRLWAAARALLPPGEAWAESLLWEQEGRLLERQLDLVGAREAQRRALALRERFGVESLPVARSLERLAQIASQRGRPDLARRHWRRCAAIRARLAPRSLERVRSLNGIAGVAFQQGDLVSARRAFHRALRVAEEVAPGGLDAAKSLVNVAMAARGLGDLAEAEEACRRALAIVEQRAPGTPLEARAFNTLALTARDRGDAERAKDLFERALALAERLSPNGIDTAGLLNNLGNLAQNRGAYDAARGFHERALRLRERLDPESLDVAASLNNLGVVARRAGRYDEAESLLKRSAALKQRLAPDGLACATPLEELGVVAAARGQDDAALEYYARALALRHRHAPQSILTAELWAATAGVLERLGRDAEALAHYRGAIESIDGRASKAGGDASRVGLAARFSDVHRRAAELLVRAGRPEEAFAVIERGRAQALLLSLSERDLVFSDVPPELERERRRLAAQYDRLQADLADLSPRSDAVRIASHARRLRELQAQRDWVDLRIRRAAPRLAAVRRPRSLDLAGARAVLDRGSRLVAFSVGSARTLLFVLSPAGELGAGLAVHVLPFGERAWADRVHALRGWVERGRHDAGSESALQAQAARLYADLLAPAQEALAGAERLVIVPDGPLHALPFAVLVRGAEPRYLVEDLPLHTVLSATLYGELRRGRKQQPGPPSLAAFGAPIYATRADEPPPGLDAQIPARARALPPLPASADEVRAIAALFPGRASVSLGVGASETRVRAVPRSTRFVHFAVHALLDWRSPFDSALAFTTPPADRPGLDNGVLQAWEVFESMRFDADLVTLSACQTALGREMGGEGLVGLVRAFHYAGARAVLASLWPVSDRSTAELMVAFYARLRTGAPKDEALRQAQLSLRRGGERGHPFHWAAFQVSGDVR